MLYIMFNDKLNRMLFAFFALTVVGVLYNRYDENNRLTDEEADYKKIKEYLLNESSIAKSKKPIMWIHIPHIVNARKWKNFGSRNSEEVNQPYLYICVKSIIDKCGNDFNICLIDDNSFVKLIPDWTLDVSKLPENLLSTIRTFGLCKLVYYYGGLVTPISSLCFKSLINVYQEIERNDKPFFLEDSSRDINVSSEVRTFPSFQMFGCKKNNETMKIIINILQNSISKDYTYETKFLGQNRRYLYEMTTQNKIYLIDGRSMGIKDSNNEEITLERLFDYEDIELSLQCNGLIIPSETILKRSKYNWFVYLNIQKILKDEYILAKYLQSAI